MRPPGRCNVCKSSSCPGTFIFNAHPLPSISLHSRAWQSGLHEDSHFVPILDIYSPNPLLITSFFRLPNSYFITQLGEEHILLLHFVITWKPLFVSSFRVWKVFSTLRNPAALQDQTPLCSTQQSQPIILSSSFIEYRLHFQNLIQTIHRILSL